MQIMSFEDAERLATLHNIAVRAVENAFAPNVALLSRTMQGRIPRTLTDEIMRSLDESKVFTLEGRDLTDGARVVFRVNGKDQPGIIRRSLEGHWWVIWDSGGAESLEGKEAILYGHIER